MSTTDRKVHQFAAHARECVSLSKSSVPINQAAVLIAAIKPWLGLTIPAYMRGWLVDAVQVFCTAIVATAQVDVQIDGVSVLTGLVTPVAGTVVQGTLVAALATKLGAPGSTLQVKATTNGTGTLTDVTVTVTIRPYPLDNEG